MRWGVMTAPRGRYMAQATSSPGGSSKTQVQAESIDSPDSACPDEGREPAKNHPEAAKGKKSQSGNAESSSREKPRPPASSLDTPANARSATTQTANSST